MGSQKKSQNLSQGFHAGMTHKPVPTAVGDTSGRDLLHYCWALAVLEQTGSEAFQIPWRALLQKQPEGNGTLATDATVFCQVCLPDAQGTSCPVVLFSVSSCLAHGLVSQNAR